MKKIMIAIVFICLFFLFKNKITNNTISVMNYEDYSNIGNVYYLNFNDEILSTNNFKLKISPFTGYTYAVRRVYPKYNTEIKEYYTYDFSYIDVAVLNFKKDYISNLRDNNLFDEIDKVNKTGVIIKGIEIYTTKEALDKFLKKYPKVKYEVINYSNM